LEEGDHRREGDEFLEVHELAWPDVLRMVGRGEILDAKTLVAILYAATYVTGR